MGPQQQKNARSASDAKDVLKYTPPPDTKPPQNKSQALIAEFQERLQHTLDAFKQKAAKQIADELPKAAEGIVRRSAKELQKIAGDAGEKLEGDLKVNGAAIASSIQKQLAESVQSSLDGVRAEAKSTAAAALKEAASAFQEQVQAASQAAGAELRSVSAAAERACVTLNAAAEQTQASLIQEHQKRAAEFSASGLQDLEHAASRNLEAFEGSLENALTTFRRAATERLDAELSKTTANLVERSAAGLQKRVDAETEKLLGKLRDSGAEAVENARRQLTTIEQATIESVSQGVKTAVAEATIGATKEVEGRVQTLLTSNADEAIARVEGAANALKVQAEQSAHDLQNKMAELSVQMLEGSWHKLDAQHEAFCEQLRNGVSAIEEEALQQAKQDFSGFALEQLEKGSDELRKGTAVAVERVNDEIKSSVSSLTEEARKQLLTEAQWSLNSLKEATAEQCRAQLSQIGKDFDGDTRKKLGAELEDSMRKYRKQAQSQLDALSHASAAIAADAARAGRAGHGGAPAVQVAAGSSRAGGIALVLAAIAPTLLFLYFVSRPVVRLAPDPPADFLAISTEWTARHPDATGKVARAYWDWAALHLAPRYPYGATLPEQPPLGFEVEGKDFPTGVSSDLTRLSYWNELRKLWAQPESWTKIEVWDR